ncbi:MAG: hypothetical protein M3245_01555 [Actinomycetota bacterium]|nr:hypothetical protein [Actinomycetota bacterium]
MELRDCTWCGSAQSIENDLCQVCLMRFPPDERVVVILPDIHAEPQIAPEAEERPAVGG